SGRRQVLHELEVVPGHAGSLTEPDLRDEQVGVRVADQAAGVRVVLLLPVHARAADPIDVEVDGGVEVGHGEAEVPYAEQCLPNPTDRATLGRLARPRVARSSSISRTPVRRRR